MSLKWHNGALTDDDLVFNNAALYTLRRRPEFDKNRIGLAGGSAGAYTRKYTYQIPGDSLPTVFDMHLPEGLPGRLSMALDECLPAEAINMEHIIVQAVDPDKPMPYDAGKQFNINIYDDGPPEGYGTHSSRLDLGRKLDVPYFREMFGRTAKETCILTPGMLMQLLERYQGKSPSLPCHTGVDDSVYGSLAIYREEIKAHLADWIDTHGAEVFRNVYTSMCAQHYDQSMKDTDVLEGFFTEQPDLAADRLRTDSIPEAASGEASI